MNEGSPFKTTYLSHDGIYRNQRIQEMFDHIYSKLWTTCGKQKSREWSLVFTHLELACLYAKKSLQHVPEAVDKTRVV